MLSGAHMIVYSTGAEADRAFLGEVLGLSSVGAGHGWLISKLPRAEVAVHPAAASSHERYFMCDDPGLEVRALRDRGVTCSEVEEARWGSVVKLTLPGGGEIGLYQPRHPTALKL